MTIKAPYNFVPLNKRVISPLWELQANHDIPFSDGESGIITLKITAQSPIYVRDGHLHGKDTNSFSKFNSRFFIPGTSIKGCIRNALEILSFSAMDKIDDNKYTYRDLSSAKGLYLQAFRDNKPHCGWLTADDEGNWFIQDCGIPRRISHKELDAKLGSDFNRTFKQQLSSDKEKTAEFKYSKFGTKARNMQFTEWKDSSQRPRVEFNNSDGVEGTIVFTGQPSPRKENEEPPTGKHLEFVFFKTSTEKEAVPEQVKKDFLFAYFDGEDGKESHDWGYWKKKLYKNGKIPVFFRKKEIVGGKNKKEILDMGLSYLYKLPYKNRTVDCLPLEHQGKKIDLAETIFGHIKNDNALKGRVHFSHAFADGNPKCLDEKKEVLASPKASYHPTYLVQENKTTYTTYDNTGVQLKGWKRYPVHSGKNIKQNRPEGVSEKIFTSFKPIVDGTTFTFKIRVHNLRKIEIGAIFSALTFHNRSDCYHSLGMAKPLGYGKVTISVENIDKFKYNAIDYMKEFEKFMEIEAGGDDNLWVDNQSITEFFTMASNQNNSDSSILEYMSLDEHAEIKKVAQNQERLHSYSQLNKIVSIHPASLLSSEERKTINKEREIVFLKRENINHIERLNAYGISSEQEEVNIWKKNGKDKDVAEVLITKVKKQKSNKKNNKKLSSIYLDLEHFLNGDRAGEDTQEEITTENTTEGTTANQQETNLKKKEKKEKKEKKKSGKKAKKKNKKKNKTK